MKKINNGSQGFTLLELLIVVLIIGILAAIALPQYQLARDKTEFIKLQSVAVSLRDAYNEYVLTNGKGTRKFENLSFTMPSDFQSSYTSSQFNCISNDNMFCCMSDYNGSHSAAISCGKNDSSFVYSESFFDPDGNSIPQIGVCRAVANNTRAHRLCSAIGKQSGSTSSYNAWTPQGIIGSYTIYILN